MTTKSDIIHMSAIGFGDATNIYDLDYYRRRIKWLDDYAPSKPVRKKVLTDRERQLKSAKVKFEPKASR